MFVQFNALHGQKKDKAKKNKKMDPLLATEATCAQGWIVEGGEEDEISDVDPVTGADMAANCNRTAHRLRWAGPVSVYCSKNNVAPGTVTRRVL